MRGARLGLGPGGIRITERAAATSLGAPRATDEWQARMRLLLVVVVLAVLGGGGYYGYREWSESAAPPRYRTADVALGDVVYSVTATGTVEPVEKVLVGSQVSGTVTRWYADFNQRVTHGELLAELDQDRFNAIVQQRVAAVAVAKARAEEAAARLAEATLERTRIEGAFAREAASEFEYQATRMAEDAARATLHAAEAQVEAAEADRQLAEIERSKTRIYAPIDGIVISRDVDAGQTVAASLSAPTLFTIANDLSHMRINAAVSETDIGRVREGMPAEFRVDAHPDRRFRGRVSQVRFAETVVDNVVTYTTLIDVDNPELLLRPGMTATIMFEVAKAENVLRVPNAALRFSPATNSAAIDWTRPGRGQAIKPRVFTLAGAELVEVSIELGLTDGAFTEVKSGDLSANVKVVIEREASRGGGGRASGPPTGQTQTRMPRM